MQNHVPNLTAERPFPGAYEIDADCLRSFEGLLTQHLGQAPECVVRFKNGRRSQVPSVEALLEDSFLHNASIKSISFSGRGENLRAELEIEDSFWTPISYRLSGQRNAVLALEAEIENLIQRPRRLYGWLLAPFGQHIAAATFIYALATITLGVIAYQLGASSEGKVPNPKYMSAAAGTLLACLGWTLLPQMIFAIGRGERRAAALKKLVSFVLITVGVAVLVNWGTALYNPLQQ